MRFLLAFFAVATLLTLALASPATAAHGKFTFGNPVTWPVGVPAGLYNPACPYQRYLIVRDHTGFGPAHPRKFWRAPLRRAFRLWSEATIRPDGCRMYRFRVREGVVRTDAWFIWDGPPGEPGSTIRPHYGFVPGVIQISLRGSRNDGNRMGATSYDINDPLGSADGFLEGARIGFPFDVWTAPWGADVRHIRFTLLHEAGHTLGLGHRLSDAGTPMGNLATCDGCGPDRHDIETLFSTYNRVIISSEARDKAALGKSCDSFHL